MARARSSSTAAPAGWLEGASWVTRISARWAARAATSSGQIARVASEKARAAVESAVQPGPMVARSAQAGEFDDAAVQGALGGERVAGGFGQVVPHLAAAIGVVVAVDPVQRGAVGAERRGEAVERFVAFHVAEQDDVARRAREAGEAAGDEVPAAVDVADEDEAVMRRHQGRRAEKAAPEATWRNQLSGWWGAREAGSGKSAFSGSMGRGRPRGDRPRRRGSG